MERKGDTIEDGLQSEAAQLETESGGDGELGGRGLGSSRPRLGIGIDSVILSYPHVYTPALLSKYR